MKNNKFKTNPSVALLESQQLEQLSETQLAMLKGELHTAQQELEMQSEELHTSAQLLQTERTKFADFFDLAPTGYFILDSLGRVIDANRIGLELLAIKKSLLLKQKLHAFVALDDLGKFSVFLRCMKPDGTKEEAEVKLQLMDGNAVYAKLQGMAIYDADERLINYYITLTDITSTKIEQQKLQVATERLSMSLRASSTGTWSVDLEAGTVFLDEFSLALLELEPSEFDNSITRFLELVHPEDRGIVSSHLLDDASHRDKIDVEFRILTKNQKIKYFVTKGHHFLSQLGKRFSIGIILDVTDRMKIAIARQELEDEKQKLILATTFAAQENERQKISNALHDSIGQLLYGIRLRLQNAYLDGDIKEELKVMNDLLDLAIKETRGLSYELTPSVLRDFGFAAGVREMAKRLSSKNFQVSTSLKETTNGLSAELQLSVFRMIQELLNNCIKHANASEAAILVCTENEMVTIIVEDNGKGFAYDLETAMAKGSGLRAIKNRLLLVAGTIDFEPLATGTKVVIRFKNQEPQIWQP